MSLGQEIQGFRVIVTRINDNPEQWSWMIVRSDGVKMVETGFTSCRAARSAGRIALEESLDRLSLKGSEQDQREGGCRSTDLGEASCSITGHPDT